MFAGKCISSLLFLQIPTVIVRCEGLIDGMRGYIIYGFPLISCIRASEMEHAYIAVNCAGVICGAANNLNCLLFSENG